MEDTSASVKHVWLKLPAEKFLVVKDRATRMNRMRRLIWNANRYSAGRRIQIVGLFNGAPPPPVNQERYNPIKLMKLLWTWRQQ